MSDFDLKVAKKWNKFVGHLLGAKRAWAELRDEVEFQDPRDFIDLDPHAVKLISVYKKAKFELMIPRFIAFYRGQGGLESMKTTVKKPRPEEEEN